MSDPAQSYEGYMVPTLFGPWAKLLVARAAPKPGERALDVGCGTGVVARQVAARIGQGAGVTGLDLSPHMLAVARASAQREGHHIDWREGRAEALPFADQSFDLVTSQFALMFFPDRPAAVREMRRVVRPRSRIVLSVWQDLERHPFYLRLHEVIRARIGISALAQIFSLGSVDELRRLFSDASFGRIEVETASLTSRFPKPSGFLAEEIDLDTAAIPSMQHLDAKARGEIVAAVTQDMASALKAATRGDHLELEFHALLVRAQP